MQVIARETLAQRIGSAEDVALVEVLEAEQYRDFHLPGARHVPLDGDFGTTIEQAVPDKNQPVVVYGWDADDPTSAQAAQQLEELGYRRVYDYTAGKSDWKEAGLPTE